MAVYTHVIIILLFNEVLISENLLIFSIEINVFVKMLLKYEKQFISPNLSYLSIIIREN